MQSSKTAKNKKVSLLFRRESFFVENSLTTTDDHRGKFGAFLAVFQ